MKNAKDILVVINRSDESGYVLDKAAALAAGTDARVHVVHVIFDDLVDFGHMSEEGAQSLKLYLMRAEEELLVDLIDDRRDEFTELDCATLWNKRVSQAVLDMAQEVEAGLVIKAADKASPIFPRHPDDWNLLREATCPILLVKPEPWVKDPVILAAVDALDNEHAEMNGRILEAGDLLAKTLGGALHIVNAYPRFESYVTDVNIGVDLAKMQRDIETELNNAISRLKKVCEIDHAELHLKEGNASNIVADVAGATHAEIVVMGTAARRGVSAFMIGNTSERLLHLLDDDLLVLHV
jgi:universal stress protein E